MKIGIIGTGSWGLALSIVLSEKNDVKVWGRRKETIEYIKEKGVSPDYLRGIELPKNVLFTNLSEELADREIVFIAVPSKYLRETVRNFRNSLRGKVVISCSKGIEFDTLEFPSKIVEEEVEPEVVGVLSGPSHAEEVSRKYPCAVTLATKDKETTKMIQQAVSTSYFRVYGWDDIIGVEVAGAYKNVVAISAGLIDGLGLGHNAKASLITRGLHEIVKLGKILGGKVETFYGLSGVGDLIVTCTSAYSRNRNLGEMIARGFRPEEVVRSSKMVAEGYYTSPAIKKMSEMYGIELPIANEVYEIIYKGKNPLDSLRTLMGRELKEEFYF